VTKTRKLRHPIVVFIMAVLMVIGIGAGILGDGDTVLHSQSYAPWPGSRVDRTIQPIVEPHRTLTVVTFPAKTLTVMGADTQPVFNPGTAYVPGATERLNLPLEPTVTMIASSTSTWLNSMHTVPAIGRGALGKAPPTGSRRNMPRMVPF